MNTCPVCHDGTLEQQLVERWMQKGDRWVLLKDIPATRCDLCGETTFSQEVTERLSRMLAADTAVIPVDFLTSPVYNYARALEPLQRVEVGPAMQGVGTPPISTAVEPLLRWVLGPPVRQNGAAPSPS